MIRSRSALAGPARTRIHGLTLLMLVSATAAAAPSVERRHTLPTVEVIGILPEDLRYTPGAASVLAADEIATFRPYTLHDALDFLPGVRTIDDDVLGRRSGIGIRGAPSRRSRKTLLLEDGVAVNAATYLDSSAHYTPPMERLESVEVLRGIGQITHGPLNNHGIVNFRNKQPTAAPETTAEFAYGSVDTIKRHLMHTRTMGPAGVVLAYTGMDADGNFDTEHFRYDDLFASLDYRLNEAHDLRTSVVYFRERSEYDESNLMPEEYAINPYTKRNRLYDLSQEFNNFSIDYIKADLTHRFRISDRWSLSNKLFYTDLDRPRFFVAIENDEDELPEIEIEDPQFVPGDPASSFMVGRERHYRTFGAETRIEVADVQALGLGHTLQAGLRYERQLFEDMRPIGRPGEILDEDNRGNFMAEDGVGGFEDDGRLQYYHATAYAVFVQDSIAIGDFLVTPGLRAEWFEQTRNNKYFPGVAGEGLGGLGSTSDENSVLLPGLSIFYNGFAQTQLFGSVQRGYAPAIARNAEGFPLLPETGINSQIGVRSTAVRGVSVELAGFYNMLQDTLVQQVFTIGDLNVVRNDGDSESYGLDLGLRVDSQPYTGASLNFFGQVAYNYTRAEFTDGSFDGNRVPEIPLHAGSITFGVEHNAGWHVSATVSHFGSFYTDSVNTEVLSVDFDDFEIDEPAVIGRVKSRTLLSARATYDIPRTPVTLWLQGRNLADRTYITDLENGIRPGAERTIIGGVRVRF